MITYVHFTGRMLAHCLKVAVHNEKGATYFAHVVLGVRKSMYTEIIHSAPVRHRWMFPCRHFSIVTVEHRITTRRCNWRYVVRCPCRPITAVAAYRTSLWVCFVERVASINSISYS